VSALSNIGQGGVPAIFENRYAKFLKIELELWFNVVCWLRYCHLRIVENRNLF